MTRLPHPHTSHGIARLLVLAVLAMTGLLAAPPAHALTDAEFNEFAATQTARQDGGAARPAPTAGETLPGLKPPSMLALLARLAIALGVVFGLMFVILWGAKKYFPKSALNAGGGMIEVVATRTLGQRRSLMVVRAQGRTLLLGATPNSINLISELDEAAAWNSTAFKAGLEEAG